MTTKKKSKATKKPKTPDPRPKTPLFNQEELDSLSDSVQGKKAGQWKQNYLERKQMENKENKEKRKAETQSEQPETPDPRPETSAVDEETKAKLDNIVRKNEKRIDMLNRFTDAVKAAETPEQLAAIEQYDKALDKGEEALPPLPQPPA